MVLAFSLTLPNPFLNTVFLLRRTEKTSANSHVTLAKTEIIYPKNVRAKVVMDFK